MELTTSSALPHRQTDNLGWPQTPGSISTDTRPSRAQHADQKATVIISDPLVLFYVLADSLACRDGASRSEMGEEGAEEEARRESACACVWHGVASDLGSRSNRRASALLGRPELSEDHPRMDELAPRDQEGWLSQPKVAAWCWRDV